jgi:hypothetical protein
MTSVNIDLSKFDYREGKDAMETLYQETEIEIKSFDDFLKLPVSDGYKNNVNRVPNDFNTAIDMSGNIDLKEINLNISNDK